MKRFLAGCLVVAVCAAFLNGARAGDGPAPSPTPNIPDKSQYTLFNPTPDKLMRSFSSDRPSAFTGPGTVDAGHFQLEMSAFTYTLDRNNAAHAPVDVDQWNVVPAELRIGLTLNTEFDVTYSGYFNVRVRDLAAGTDSTQSGFGDLTLAYKYNLFGNDKGSVAFALIPYLKIPTNTDNLGNHSVEGGLLLPLSVNLPGNLNLGVQTEFDALQNDADTHHVVGFTNIAVLGWTFLDRFQVYGEFASLVKDEAHSEVAATVNTGLLYFIGGRSEIDFGCNFGVTRAAADYMPFAGFSVRF